MKILIVGPGVIGSVYGAHLSKAGHDVSVMAHGNRTDEIARRGLRIQDVNEGSTLEVSVPIVSVPGAPDLVLVAVRCDQLAQTCSALRTMITRPTVLLFGNNPAGSEVLPEKMLGPICLGFPGVGGTLTDGLVRYVRIPQQPTALQRDGTCLAELASALKHQGFAIQRVEDMNGWLVYHAVFVSCIAAALSRCGGEAARLAADRDILGLMCKAIAEGFRSLRRTGLGGLPRNLAFLHHRALLPIAIRYWARTFRSPMGELCFAAHVRHAGPEMRHLGADVLRRVDSSISTQHLWRLLADASKASAFPL